MCRFVGNEQKQRKAQKRCKYLSPSRMDHSKLCLIRHGRIANGHYFLRFWYIVSTSLTAACQYTRHTACRACVLPIKHLAMSSNIGEIWAVEHREDQDGSGVVFLPLHEGQDGGRWVAGRTVVASVPAEAT